MTVWIIEYWVEQYSTWIVDFAGVYDSQSAAEAKIKIFEESAKGWGSTTKYRPAKYVRAV